MMYLDKMHGSGDGTIIYKTKNINYPLSKDKFGKYKIKSGETIRVCMNSDFFIEEADTWREEAWSIMRERSDVIFFLLTKRPQRVFKCLPSDWDDGYDNVFFNVTCENQKRVDERIPILKELPFKHKGIMCAPLVGEIDIDKYLEEGFIEQVICGGENYGGSRVCDFEWVKKLSNQCKKNDVTFAFIETGSVFKKDGKIYNIKNKFIQTKMACKSNVSYKGKQIDFVLKDVFGNKLDPHQLYVPMYTSVNCEECGNRLICNGCSNCGKCQQKDCV